jgi:hypothetical protein
MDFNKIISITVLVFSLLTLTFNFIRKPFYIPGDLTFDKLGFKFYIPIFSTVILSVLITFLLSMIPQ